VIKKKKKKTPPQGDSKGIQEGSGPLAQSNRPSHTWEQNYGDLVYDLFYSILWNHKGAGTLYLSFWNQMDRELSKEQEHYQKYARPWVLRGAIESVLTGIQKHGRVLTPAEQVMLDANLDVHARQKQFESYLHKLSPQDHILMLLRDKYGLPYEEISAALGLSEGAIRIKRQQALRSLEEWLWDRT